jgi:PAS domain S-box-containing protein
MNKDEQGNITQRKLTYTRIERLRHLDEALLSPGSLRDKAKRITDDVVDILDADFARIWIARPGDLCESGCIHATVEKGPHVCLDRNRCLHLVASSGRYTHTDGEIHRRVPFGCYKIGRVAAAKEAGFLTNDVMHDPRVHDHEWARQLGLVSFAGYRLISPDREPIGVLALFAKHTISPEDQAYLMTLSGVTSQVILTASMEEQLKEKAYIIESASSVIATCDNEGIMTYVNPAFLAVWGFTEVSEILGRPFWEFWEVYDQRDEILTVLQNEGRWFSEIKARKKDGTLFDVQVAAASVRDQAGNPIGLMSTSTDITEKKQAEQERRLLESRMQHAQKLESLGVLAGGIAHDFNNLLVGILGHADMALTEMPTAAPGRKSVEEVKKAAVRASELSNQMLAYSGKGRFVVKSLNLNDVVNELGQLLEAAISKKTTLQLNLAERLPPVEVDVTQIRQVVMNLVTNASEALGGESGRVTISTGSTWMDQDYLASSFLDNDLPEGHYVHLEVSDTGCGIDAETRSKLFEPFFTTKTAGRGLGLAAVLGIVRGHRGTIRVYSEPGKGTSFRIILPAGSKPTEKIPAPSEKAEQTWRFEGIVLVVDDDPRVRGVAKLMLEHCGFSVLIAEDGEVGVATFREHADEITLVLLDMTMPRMGGEEAFRELRRIQPNVKVLLTSGYNEQEATNLFTTKGLAGFIRKPFDLKTLVSILREVLEGRK